MLNDYSLLRQLTEADIKREGTMGSTMVRSGLVIELLDRLETLHEATQKSRDQFQFYAEQHKIKHDAALNHLIEQTFWGNEQSQSKMRTEAAKRKQQLETNVAFVDMCDAALKKASDK